MLEKSLTNLLKLRDAYDEKLCVMAGELRKLASEYRKVVDARDSYDNFPDVVESLSIYSDDNGQRVLSVSGTLYGSRSDYRSVSINLPLQYIYADAEGQKAYLAEVLEGKQKAISDASAVVTASVEASERAMYEALKEKFG